MPVHQNESRSERARDRGPPAPRPAHPRKGRRLLNAITSLVASALAVFAVLVVVVPATPRSLTASTSADATERSIASPNDESLRERAATVSRSLGAERRATPAPERTPAPTPSVEDARSFALSRIGAEEFSCLDALWQHESDWDPFAENPTSGAYGIAQALPAAKMASAGEDWASNPVTQVSWGLGYIAARYGSACNAWSFWLSNYPHWY